MAKVYARNLFSVDFQKTGATGIRECDGPTVRATLMRFAYYTKSKDRLEEGVANALSSYQMDAGSKTFDDGNGFENHIVYVGY